MLERQRQAGARKRSGNGRRTHEDVGLVLVDGNGDGAELEMEYWYKNADGWEGGQSFGHGSLEKLLTSPVQAFDTGSMVFALGAGSPGATVVVRYEGEDHICTINEFGLWGFVRKSDGSRGRLPQVVSP